MPNKQQNAFTLIELSIVLVIIGLIVGGIMVGRDLIKTSEIRAQISQIEEFKTAVSTFQVKYGYLPGDMPPSQASQLGFFTFTGAAAGLGCVTEEKAFGNNDGSINFYTEMYPFWSHLSDAKLLKGSYGGIAGDLLSTTATTCASTGGQPIIGGGGYAGAIKFFPPSKMASDVGIVRAVGNYFGAPNRVTTPAVYSNTQRVNMFQVMNYINTNDTFSAYEMYQIDSKIDDGLPALGDVRDYYTGDYGTGTPSSDPPCTTGSGSSLTYRLSAATSNTRRCNSIMFLF